MKSTIDRGPLIAGGLALVTAFSTTLPWARTFIISMNGTDSDRGIITLIAALAGAGICAWRAFFGLDAKWYFAAGLSLGLIASSMPAWFLIDLRNAPSIELFGEEVGAQSPRFALYLTVVAAFGYVAALLLEASIMAERWRIERADKLADGL